MHPLVLAAVLSFVAAGLYTILRYWDTPFQKITQADIVDVAKTLLGGFIAAMFGFFINQDNIIDFATWQGVLTLASYASGGITFVVALMNRINPPKSVEPPNGSA